MKKIFHVPQTSSGIDAAILIARIGIAFLMLTHGLPKMSMLFSGDPVSFPALFGLSGEASLGLTVFAEVFCSLLILAGFATRLAVIPLAITMLVAVFLIHGADPFAKKELALQYLLTYVVLFLAGSGKFSLDYLVQQRKQQPDYKKVNIKDPAFAVSSLK